MKKKHRLRCLGIIVGKGKDFPLSNKFISTITTFFNERAMADT